MATDLTLFAEALEAVPQRGPLWHRLSGAIERLIAGGQLGPGDSLPPERDLAGLAGISRVTVRSAIGHLVAEGRLERRQGSGTYVAGGTKPEATGRTLISLSEDMRRRGMKPASRWMARSLHMPVADEIMALALGLNERVARLERVRLDDGRPLAVERASIPAALLPDPEAVEQSLYDFLAARGIRPERAIQRLSAANATPRDADALGILPGAAVLRVERITFLPGGRPAEFSRTFYRGDAYDIVSELR